jgi:hypothetical protein
MAWRDKTRPYALAPQAKLGHTQVQFTGTGTGTGTSTSTVTGQHGWRAHGPQVVFSDDSVSSVSTLTGVKLHPHPPAAARGSWCATGLCDAMGQLPGAGTILPA